MAETKIEWCDFTFNPWEGCQKIAPECANCYAADRDKRYHKGKHWGPEFPRFEHTDAYWKQPLKWNAEADRAMVRKKVFCMSLGDIMEDRRDLDPLRERVWELIEETEWLDWLLLTKRPENFGRLMIDEWPGWPRKNVWLGVSAGTQAQADKLIPILLRTPTAVRFLSCEPLLEAVKLPLSLEVQINSGWKDYPVTFEHRQIDGVIVGGESGPGARPCHIKWIRSIVKQCWEANTACFVKQVGASPIIQQGCGDCDPCLYGQPCMLAYDVPLEQRNRKGGDPAEWPEDIRVREMPEAPHA